jgi:hypothetical protein
MGWVVTECWRFIVHTVGVAIIEAKMAVLSGLILTAHQLKLETGVLVKGDNAKDDKACSHRQWQGDHGQLTVVTCIKTRNH